MRKTLRILVRAAYALPLFFVSFIVNAQTEVNTSFADRMNYVFQQLEKNRLPNGLLLDYAMEFTNLSAYNGAVLADSNKVNAGLLRDIYATVFMSAIHGNAGGFYSPDYVDSIWQLQRQSGLYP